MKVKVLSKTSDMVETISFAAGVCYGKRDSSLKRIENCYKVGHSGIMEHGSISFLVEGISRSCSHQLVRHRMASYCQESQRYCKYDLDGDEWYVVPPKFKEQQWLKGWFKQHMNACAAEYMNAVKNGVKPEDARFMLPEAMKTTIVVTQNLRQLFHFFDLRLGPRAQWEIRELAEQMAICMENEEPELMAVYYEFREQTRID